MKNDKPTIDILTLSANCDTPFVDHVAKLVKDELDRRKVRPVELFDWQYHNDQRRARERVETIETARLAELARLRARDEYEASKAAPDTETATRAPVVAASDGIEKRRAKKPTIEAVALDYMREVYRTGQFQSAAKFHKHLTQTAGSTGSPFEMGTGDNARKLFCPAASSFFDSGTLGKMWQKIRAE